MIQIELASERLLPTRIPRTSRHKTVLRVNSAHELIVIPTRLVPRVYTVFDA